MLRFHGLAWFGQVPQALVRSPRSIPENHTLATKAKGKLNMPTLIVFCHLRWDFVFQRPQHLMTRLAEHYQILFVEEPVYDAGQAPLKKTAVAPNVTLCQPHTPIHAAGVHDDQIPALHALLADLVPEGEQPVV